MVPRGLEEQGDIKGSIGSCGNILWEGMKNISCGRVPRKAAGKPRQKQGLPLTLWYTFTRQGLLLSESPMSYSTTGSGGQSPAEQQVWP